MNLKLLGLGCLFLANAAIAAEPYDQKLEFVETTGTQWFDTGLKLNYKKSVARVNVRVVEAPTTKNTCYGFAGATGVKNNIESTSSSAIAVRTRDNGGVQWVCAFTGATQDTYCFPQNGNGITDLLRTFEIENSEKLHTSNPSYYGTNKWGRVNGAEVGGYYKAPDTTCPYGYYIGAVNNAGSGLLPDEGSLPKLQWFGVKIWNEGELVGDFIPVLKNGVAGFYDNVSEQFFASQGADAFVAPTEVVWTGAAADGDLTNGNNWQGGAAPSTIHQVAVFPADTQITVTIDAACAALNNVGAIRIGEGAQFEMNGLTAVRTFYPAVGGTGKLRYAAATSNVNAFHTWGSLENFYGECMITNIHYFPRTPYTMGAAGRSDTIVYQEGGSQRLYFYNNSTTHAKIHLRKSGQFMFSGDTADNDATWVYDGMNVGHHHNGGGDWTYYGEMIGNTEGANTYEPFSGAWERYAGKPKNFNLTQLSLSTAMKVKIATQFHTTPRVHQTPFFGSTSKVHGAVGSGQEMANIRVSSGNTLAFGCVNALDEHAFLQFGYADGVSAQKNNVLDLGGYDNRVGTLSVWASTYDPTTLWNPNLCITSAVPAVLTICGDMRSDGAAHVFPGLVRGAAGVKLDSKDEIMAYTYDYVEGVAGKIKFNAPGSDTTGTLAVNRGTMEIMETATFSNLSEVVVSGTGVMNIMSPAVGIENSTFTARIKDATATLYLTNGVALACDVCEIPNGEYLMPGTYSGTAQAGVTYCEYLQGEGTVTVAHYGKPWSGWPEAGTKTEVYILKDTVVTIEDSDIEKVEALQKVECGDGVTFLCALTAGNAIDFKPKFVGNPKIYYWGKGAGDTLTISGDNSGLVAPGGFVLSNCIATVTHRYGLGDAETAPVEIYSTREVFRSALYFAGDATQNDVALYFYEAGAFGYTNTTADVTLVQNADYIVDGSMSSPSIRRHFLRGKMSLTDGHRMYIRAITMEEMASLTIDEGARLESEGNFGSGYYEFYGKYFGCMAIEQCNYQMRFWRDNVLNTSYIFTYDTSMMSFQLDLNGHNQAITRIYGNQYPYTSNWERQQAVPVISAAAATLSITGNVSATTKAATGIYFRGAAGCRIASGNTQSNVFGKGVSRTSGSLVMDSGLLTLERDFTWIGPETQLNGGTLIIDADTTTNVFGQARGLTDRNWMNLKLNGGTLQLNSELSVTTEVYSVQSASDGSYLPQGVYPAPYGNWLKGTGTLRVLHQGPRPGIMMLIR